MDNKEFNRFLSENKNLFNEEEVLVLQSDDYRAASEIIQKKRHLLPSTTRINRLILSMMRGDINLPIISFIRANMFFPSKTAEQYLLYLDSVGSVIYGTDHYTRRTNMNNYLICHTFQGKGMLEYGGKVFELYPGDAFLIDCRKPHYYYCKSDRWGYDVIHFNGNPAAAYYLPVEKSGSMVVHVEGILQFEKSLDLLKRYCENPSLYDEYKVNLAMTAILTTFTDSCAPDRSKAFPDWLRAALTLIRSDFYEELSLDKIAREVNISKYHLSKAIKSYTGKTFTEYLNQTRLEEAKILLLTTDLPVSVIAELAGFQSEPYFITLFKRYNNITPMKFRKGLTRPQ